MDDFEEEEDTEGEEMEIDILEDFNDKDHDDLKYLLSLNHIHWSSRSEDYDDFGSKYYSAKKRFDEDSKTNMAIRDYVSLLTSEKILTRTLYTVDWMIDPEKYPSISSLLYLCCKEITRDANLLGKISTLLPTNRYEMLMKTAISLDSYDSAEILMLTWPLKSISLSVIDCANLLRSLRISYRFYKLDADVVALLVKPGLFWWAFFKVVKCEPKSRLRVLDLRGVPLGDLMVSYLIRDITALSADISLSNPYHVIIDCAINGNNTCEKLKEFLVRAKKYCVKLHINTIDIFELREDETWALVKLLDQTELIGLRLNPNFTSSISSLYYDTIFNKFSSLKNLDLPIVQLPNTKLLPFKDLPNLRRLGLRTGEKPLSATVPIEVICKLECLNIAGQYSAKIIEDDFRFLMSMPLTLRELDLSGRVMEQYNFNLWGNFLKSLAPTLTILKLNGCIRDETSLPSLVSVILPLINLQCLFFGAHSLQIRVLYENLPKLSVLPKLETVRVIGLSKVNLCRVINSPELTARIRASTKPPQYWE